MQKTFSTSSKSVGAAQSVKRRRRSSGCGNERDDDATTRLGLHDAIATCMERAARARVMVCVGVLVVNDVQVASSPIASVVQRLILPP